METTQATIIPNLNDLCNHFVEFIKTQGKFAELKYILRPENEVVIKKLVMYFFKHPDSTLDKRKGIYLCGPVGTGKTTLIKLFSAWLQHIKQPSFNFVSCRDLQQQFAQEGYQGLLKYTKLSYKHNGKNRHPSNGYIVYCFDDFGAEGNSNFFGNKANVMEEVLQDRYREYEDHGMITHMTSNMKPGSQAMRDKYTTRVDDRIFGMFNIVELLGDSFRR